MRRHDHPGTFMQPALTFVDLGVRPELGRAAVRNLDKVEGAIARNDRSPSPIEIISRGQSWLPGLNGGTRDPMDITIYSANKVKNVFFQAMANAVIGGDAELMLPENVPAEILEQLCSETPDGNGGWRVLSGRKAIALNCHNLARAAFIKLGLIGSLRLAA